MANSDVSVIVTLNDKLTAPLRAVSSRVSGMVRGINRALDLRGLDKMGQGLQRTASGLGQVAKGARTAAGAVAGYAVVMAGLAAKFIGPAAEMERFQVQLTNLEGSSAGAKKAMGWIQEFATRTPLELTDTVSAYARLRAYGIDPTNGSLQALVDTMAATGGGAEQLDGLVLALGQAWTKGKLQGEEALQMLERGVPVWDLLAQKLGKTTAEVQDMATKGKLGREEITLLVDALAERNAGASESMSRTWGGIISNLLDHWTRFQVMVMDSGVFDYLKSRLQIVLDTLNRMSADGSLQMWADRLAKTMLSALTAIWDLGTQTLALWREWKPTLMQGVELLGGWENTLKLITGLMFAKTLFGIGAGLVGMVVGIGQVSAGALMLVGRIAVLTGWLVTGFGRAAMWLARAVLPLVSGALSVVRVAIMALGRALMANPIGLAVAAIAGAAYLIYRNWGAVGPWFSRLWGGVKQIFSGVAQFLKGIVAGDFDLAVAGLKRAWSGIEAFFRAIWDGIKSVFRAAWENVIRPITDKLGITDPIVQGWGIARDALQTILSTLGGFFDLAWTSFIKPMIDGLFSISGVGAVWESIKEAIGAVLDWLAEKFQSVWGAISPVIDALKWIKDKGAEALSGLGLGGTDAAAAAAAGAKASAENPGRSGLSPSRQAEVLARQGARLKKLGVPGYASGGSFRAGPIVVGEAGAELRYESRAGFIAHHGALRSLVGMSQRARDLARGAAQGSIPVPSMVSGGRQSMSFAPVYNVSINGSGLNEAELRRAIRDELQQHGRRARADLRRLMHD